MQPITFDDLDNQGSVVETDKPFFAINHSSEDEVLTWLRDTFQKLQQNSWMRLEKVKWNYYRYKGIQYLGQVYQPRDTPETRKRYMPQMVIPLIRDAVDEKVARMMESKPTVTVIPRDDEERDKVASKIAKRFLSHVDVAEKMPGKLRSWLKNAEISGEAFLLPRWNPDKGDTIPEAQMLSEELGPRKYNIRQGDIEIVQFNPHQFFYEEHPSKDFNQVNFIFLVEYEYTEALKRDYPRKAGDIRSEPTQSHYFDYESLEEKPLQGFTKKITFYHRPTKFMPEGFEACFVNGAILKMGSLPKEYQEDCTLPPVRLILSKNEEEIHGESSIEPVRGLAGQVNNYENLIIKQTMLCAHPKWFVEDGSINEQQLNNDVGIVKVKRGAAKPVLAQANPVSPQIIQHSQQLQEKFYAFAKSNSVVRGEPPTGVNAFVALQYVSEAESRRLSTEVQLFYEAVVSVYQKILKVAAKRYRPGEERTMYIVGKDNSFNLRRYDPETLKKNFAVVLQNTSGLPDSRAARIQALIETENRWPGLVPREQVAEMIGFGQSPDKMYDLIGAAARAAEAENEQMLDGDGMVEPAEWEMHIVHWKVHVSPMQDPGFKTLPPERQEPMKAHLRATEMLMMDQMAKSPAFAQMVQVECPQFPMMMEPPPPPPMPPEMLPPDAGAQDIEPAAMGEVPAEADLIPEGLQTQDAVMAGEGMDFPPPPPPEAPQPI